MKKLMFILAMAFFMVGMVACDIIEEPYFKENNGGGQPGEETAVKKYVLLEDYTGVKCVNCPAAGELALQLQEQHHHQVIVLSVHAGSLAEFPLFDLTTTGSDPAIFCKNLDINLKKTGFTKVTVGIKYVCERPEIIPQLFFVAGNEATFNETASVKAEKQSGTSAGKVVEFVFDMSQNPRWFGLLSQIRFDPYSGNGIFSVDYIRLS